MSTFWKFVYWILSFSPLWKVFRQLNRWHPAFQALAPKEQDNAESLGNAVEDEINNTAEVRIGNHSMLCTQALCKLCCCIHQHNVEKKRNDKKEHSWKPSAGLTRNWMAPGKNHVAAISTEIFKYVRIHPNFASGPVWFEKMFLCFFS